MFQRLLDPSVNAKAWYLWCFASLVSVGPFLNVFFHGRGLSKAQVGLIGALRPWTSAPASFAWAALADRLHAHRIVLLFAFVGSTALRMLLLLPRGFGGLLAVMLAAEVLAAPVGVLADAAVMRICKKESDYGKYRLWGAVGWGTFSTIAGWLITHLGIHWAFYTQAALAAPCLFHGARLFTPCQGYTSLVAAAATDAGGSSTAAATVATTNQLRNHDNSAPEERAQCAGHDLDCYLEGDGDHNPEESDPLLVAEDGKLKQLKLSQHSTGMQEGGIARGTGAAVTAAPPEVGLAGRLAQAFDTEDGWGVDGAGPDVGCDHEEAGHGSSHWQNLSALLRRGDVLLFFVTTTVMGYGFGTIDSFLFLYLEGMGASGTLMGLTLTITCAAEVPAFQLQDRLLDRWGVSAVLDLVQVVYALRMALYAALPLAGNVMWVLPVEVLHGITFACGWGAGTVNCKLLAPPALAATLQGAFQGLYFGLGYGLGSLVGGWVGTKLGWQGMFSCAAATMLIFWIATVVARRILMALGMASASKPAGKSVQMSQAMDV